jgi:hypothetical protein
VRSWSRMFRVRFRRGEGWIGGDNLCWGCFGLMHTLTTQRLMRSGCCGGELWIWMGKEKRTYGVGGSVTLVSSRDGS